MKVSTKQIVKKSVRSASNQLRTATSPVLEMLENRMMLSTTITDWAFDNYQTSGGTPVVTNPTPSIGAGTANSIGMQPTGTFGTSGASGTGDASYIIDGAQNNGTTDYSSTGSAGNGAAWKVVGGGGGGDGWSSNAAVGTQGTQFMVSTVGYSGISLQLDLDASSGKPPSELQVQYTTDGSSWINATNIATGVGSNGATDGVTVATNSTNSNIVDGTYFQWANNADALDWQNGLTANFSSISAADNDPNFGVRIVNAATGSAEFEVTGTGGTLTPYPAAGAGNYRFDNVQILASGSALSQPSINTNPASQTVDAGQPVSFTAAASGNPTPTVQWYEGAPGSGTLITGANSSTYTFTTNPNGSENANTYYALFTNSQGSTPTTAATLNDPLSAPAVTVQPSAVSTVGGNTVTFTASATGSPAPTVQWQSSPDNTSWSNVSGGTTTTTGLVTSSTYTLTAATSQTGTYYRAVFINSQNTSGVASNSALLTVSGATLASWSFSGTEAASSSLVSLSASTTGVAVVNNQLSGNPALAAIGMTESGGSSTNAIDITPTAGTAHSSFTESLWRVRGAGTGNNGDTNGWWTLAPEYTQGAEIDLNTTDYNLSSLNFDWYVTGSGVKDLMVQYNTDTANSAGWTNLLSTPLVATSGDYYNGAGASPTNTVSLSGISLPADDTEFGLRLVSAYDPNFPGSTEYSSAASNSTTQTQIANTGGNWRFGNIQIAGTQIPFAPTITQQPTPQTVTFGSPVTFTAAAQGFPTPTVQWYSGNVSSPTLITGANSSSYTFTPTAGQNGNTYFAVFTNNLGSTPTNVVGLTVNQSPVITVQPASVNISAGSTATFTAAATGFPAPTVQWQSSTNGINFTNVSGGTSTPTTGGTSSTYSVTASSADAGDFYRAVFTNSTASATSNAAGLTVLGGAFSQWIFTANVGETIETTLSDASLIPDAAGSADAPLATFTANPYNSSTNTGDIAQTEGLFNDYTGTPVFSGADINAVAGRSTINPNFDPYSWRIRSEHTIDGWSQLAPELTSVTDPSTGQALDPQGVLFKVNTTGYTDITLHFQWLGGGIADMQPQYSTDGGNTWQDAGSILQNFSSDYPGITSKTTPPGYYVSLEGPQYAAAYNNPNFEMRLVTAYDPNLPLISDGNLDEPLTVHGQYASSNAGAQDAQQVLDLGGLPTFGANQNNVSGGTYQLSYGGYTTSAIAYNAAPTDVQNALNALPSIGGAGASVSVVQTLITPNTQASASDDFLTITFGGSLADTAVATITVTNNQLIGTSPTAAVTTWVPGAAAAGIGANGYETGVTRFEDVNAQTGAGGGAWELSDFSFNGLGYNGAPAIIIAPASQTIVGGTSVTFTSTDYSESSPVTAQWQSSTGSAWTNINGANNYNTANSTSTYTYTSQINLSDNGTQFRVVFTNPNGATASVPATLTTVAPVSPTVTLEPLPASAQVGDVATFTANGTGSPPPTVQWQVDTGSGWSNVANGALVSGAQTDTLSITTAASQAGSGTEYRAAFINVLGTAYSNAVTLSVLLNETVLADWNFANSPLAYNNSPAPVIGSGTASGIGMNIPYNPSDPASGTNGNGAVNADDVTNAAGAANPNFNENVWRIRGGVTATAGGAPANGWSNFAQEYTQGVEFQASTVGYSGVYVTMDWYATTSSELDARQQYTTDGINWYNLDDQQLAWNGSTNPSTGLDDLDPNDPYAPIHANSNDFYGATETSDPTTITSVSLTNNVASIVANNNYQVGQFVTIAGVTDAQFNGLFTITAASSTDFSYDLTGANVASTTQTAATAALGGYIVPLVFNLSNIPGAANNPNFGIRLVNAYDPTLPDITSELIGQSGPSTHGQYAVASSFASPTPYPGSAGNWRFDNIVVHGAAMAPAWLSQASITDGGAVWNAATETLTVTGSATIIGDPAASGDSPLIIATGPSADLVVDSETTRTVNIGGLELSDGATVTVSPTSTTDNLILAAGGELSIDYTSKLDLKNNFMDVQDSSSAAGAATLATLQQLLAIGFDNGTWAGNGITSSTAEADSTHLHALGVMENNGVYGTGGSLGTFGGTEPGTYDVLLRLTYYGDANLDGKVDASDYSLVDSAYLTGLAGAAGWVDFNYDGALNGSDYTLIDNAFNMQGTQLSPAAQIAQSSGVFANGARIGTLPTQNTAVSTVSDLLKKDRENLFVSSSDVLDELDAATT